jgi:tRNA(adenine34) deaminase
LHAPAYVSDLPSLSGLRMHYVDQGPSDSPITWLCLHSSLRWSYVFNRLLSELSPSVRVVAPDLIGFGRSDKPKKESFHQVERHQQVLLDFVERLQLKRLILVLDGWDEGLGLLLCAKMASYVEGVLVFTDGIECGPSPESMHINDAPFPDKGHRVAPRIFSEIQREIENQSFFKLQKPVFLNVKKLFFVGNNSFFNFKFFQKNINFESFEKTTESGFDEILIKIKNYLLLI